MKKLNLKNAIELLEEMRDNFLKRNEKLDLETSFEEFDSNFTKYVLFKELVESLKDEKKFNEEIELWK